MKTHQRTHGTMDFWPKSADERIAAFRQIVHDCQYAKIDGCMVDLFSAQYVVQIYDALNQNNQEKFMNNLAPKVVMIAFKLAKAA